MRLTSQALEIIAKRENLHLRNRLALEMGKHQTTIMRWIDENDVMLTTATALQIIKEETGLAESELLTNEQTAA